MDSPSNGTIDEAQEKLFGESNSSGSKIEIKFVTDPKNGDTKINISEVKQVFVGMGKEELMQFANNPFWVRMRLFLFILFWAIWFGMLAGAIAIILLAPKCSAPAPSKWYEESPIYHLNLKNFKDSNGDGFGDLQGLESKLDYFKDFGVEAILLDPIMKTAEHTDDVIDFKSINPIYGTFDDLKNLVASAKNKGLHLLMKIVPNFSSNEHEWFNKSIAGEEPFKDYYVWTDPKSPISDPVPRNNWLTVNGDKSAWTYNAERKQFYLHQFNDNQPDLNFRNPDVVKYFEDVYKFWLSLGFDGLYLDKVEYLVEDEQFLDEVSGGNVGKIHDEYDFYESHSRTSRLQESYNILNNWSEVFKNHSAIFAVSGVADLKAADILWRPINVREPLKSSELENIIVKRLNKTSQAWGFTCDKCDERLQAGLQAILLMLPGTAIISGGTEIGLSPSSIFQWDTSENHGFTSGSPWKPFSNEYKMLSVESESHNVESYFSLFKKIIKERRDPSILHGSTNLKHDKSLLIFTRTKSGSPHYLILFNINKTSEVVDVKPFIKENEVELKLIASFGYNHTINKPISISFSQKSATLEAPGLSFAVYQYIPDSE